MNHTLKPSSLNAALNRINYAPAQVLFGSSSDGLTPDKFSIILDSSNISRDSKVRHSNFFEESANQIIKVIAALNHEQRKMVLCDGVDVFEMMNAMEFESTLQATLAEKQITTRKTKI